MHLQAREHHEKKHSSKNKTAQDKFHDDSREQPTSICKEMTSFNFHLFVFPLKHKEMDRQTDRQTDKIEENRME